MAKTFEELIAWQLAHELKCEVFEFTSHGTAARDFKYRDQIRDSSASAPANIAEGFGRKRPAEFARFLEFAISSLAETRNHLIDGRDRAHLGESLFSRLSNLARAAEKATNALCRERQRAATRDRERKRGGHVGN